MFSNVFSTIWSNSENRILEKQIHGETVVLAEHEGRLCAAKRVGNEFVSLILSGIPTKVNKALDKALTYAQLKDSNLQLLGPQLTVLPRLKGGDWKGPFPREFLTNSEQLRNWLQQHPELTELDLTDDTGARDYCIGTEGAITLAAALPYSQITSLCLQGNQIGVEGAKAIANALAHSRVTSLDISSNEIGPGGAIAFASALSQSQVTHLDLTDNEIGSEGAKAVANTLPHSRVNRLELHGNKIGPEGIEALTKALPFSQVDNLDLSYNHLSSNCIGSIAAVMPFSQIRTLSLDRNHVQDNGAEALAAVLPHSQISYLDLNHCKLGQKGVQALVEMLPRSHLTRLNLKGNAINTENAKALAAALPDSQIIELDLAYTGLEDKGLKAIALILAKTQISYLILDGNLVGDEGTTALAQALPQSKITHLSFYDAKCCENTARALVEAISQSQISNFDFNHFRKESELQTNIINSRHQEFFGIIRNGTVEEVGKLLDQGIPIHAIDKNLSYETALHIAVRKNNRDLVILLLKRGAALIDNNYSPDRCIEKTPLDLARELGHHDLVELLEAGLPVPIPTPDPVPVPKDYYCSITQEIMYDPVLLAGDGGTYDREAIEKWLETSDLSPLHGSPLASKLLIPNQFCKGQIQDLIEKYPHLEKETYIPEASKKACLTALAERNVNSLKDLLKDRRLLSVEFPNGLLIELACQSSPEILQTVIEACKPRPHFNHELCAKAAQGLGVEGVSLLFHMLPKKVPTGLLPALFEAIKLQSGAYLEALLKMGVSPNSRDLRGSYPLHRAVEAGSKELITILMEHDANLKAVDREGRTPLQLAEQLGKLDLVRHIKQKKIEIKLRPLLAPLQEQINAQGRVIQQLRGSLFEAQTSLGNIVPLLGANPSLSSVADELVALQKRIDQHFS